MGLLAGCQQIWDQAHPGGKQIQEMVHMQHPSITSACYGCSWYRVSHPEQMCKELEETGGFFLQPPQPG